MIAQPCIDILGVGHAGGRVAQHLRALGHQGKIYLIGKPVDMAKLVDATVF